MSSWRANAAIAFTLASATGSACAMNSGGGEAVRCAIVDAGKLAEAAGGADTICDSIRAAAAAQRLGKPFAVEIRVHSPSRLAAIVTTADGRRLPELGLVSADRKIGRAAIDRFAASVIAQVQADRG